MKNICEGFVVKCVPPALRFRKLAREALRQGARRGTSRNDTVSAKNRSSRNYLQVAVCNGSDARAFVRNYMFRQFFHMRLPHTP